MKPSVAKPTISQSINPEAFRHFRALQVLLFFITTQLRYLINCRNITFGCVPISQKTITTALKESVYETKLELIKGIINETISLGCDGPFSSSAAINQQNSVRDVVNQSQIQIISISIYKYTIEIL